MTAILPANAVMVTPADAQKGHSRPQKLVRTDSKNDAANWQTRSGRARYAARTGDERADDTTWVREQLGPEVAAAAGPEMLDRYVRATHGDLKLAVKRIQDTLEWRDRERPDQMVCSVCQDDPSQHYLHLVGYDKLNRPVLYSCNGMSRNHDVEANRRHMISTFEQAIKLMPPHVEQWVWVADFHGFGLVDCDPRLGKIFLNVSADHYPERLGHFVIVDAPRLFNGVWRALQPWVDPVTKNKIRMLPYDAGGKRSKGALAAGLEDLFDPELTSWLLTEMAENRNRSIAKKKVYKYEELAPALSVNKAAGMDGVAIGTSLPAAGEGFSPSGHDLRGTPKMVQTLKAKPEVLRAFVPADSPIAISAAS